VRTGGPQRRRPTLLLRRLQRIHLRHDVVHIKQAAREGKKRLDNILKRAEGGITASKGEI